jgi:hypothetical protein
MSETISQFTPPRLPNPSPRHATCAWCRAEFSTIVALIDHVDFGHLADARMAS